MVEGVGRIIGLFFLARMIRVCCVFSGVYHHMKGGHLKRGTIFAHLTRRRTIKAFLFLSQRPLPKMYFNRSDQDAWKIIP